MIGREQLRKRSKRVAPSQGKGVLPDDGATGSARTIAGGAEARATTRLGTRLWTRTTLSAVRERATARCRSALSHLDFRALRALGLGKILQLFEG